ncbi:MAG: response regulator transcription factor [Thermodesulfobacteriota bacterium]|nr:response regulator transcription factor [Thermodesulfobacteriota bacterium]
MKRHPYRIVLADDHTIVRQGIKRVIEEKADLTVVGEASDGLELLSLLKILDADLVILDISMPNLRGIEATRELKRIFPDVKVLILTMYKDKELLHHAFSSGADGYVLKEDTDEELHTAIEKIRKGKVYISPRLSEGLTNASAQIRRNLLFKPPLERLTEREMEILRLIAEGKSNKEIANLLFISIRTVQNHRANIMSKLGIKKTADLIRYAIHQGYTS